LLTTTITCTALLGLGAASQASADSTLPPAPAGYKLIDEGHYTIQNGVISGELPPGVTLKTLKGDPSDPSEQQLIDHAKPVNLRSADGRADPSVEARVATGAPAPLAAAPAGTFSTQASYNDGCVTLFVDQVPGTGFAFHGNMVGCRRGDLYLHSYVRKGEAGAVINNGHENDCANSTSCSTLVSYYTGGEPVITFAAHGVNHDTGGSSTATAAYGRIG
jgi:hypothetical protein